MKKLLSFALSLALLATYAFAAPMSVGVENAQEATQAQATQKVSETTLAEEVTQATFIGNPDLDTSEFGELHVYDDLGSQSSTAQWVNLGKDRTGNKFYRGPEFTKNSALNVAISCPNNANAFSNGSYYSNTSTVSNYGYTDLYDGIWFSSDHPKGTYTVVVDIRFHSDDAKKIGFGAFDKNHEDMVEIGSYTVGEWATYTRTFYSDSVKGGMIGSVVAWDDAAKGEERTFDYDNIAIYYLPDRTITFENTEGGVSVQSQEVIGQYADISGVTATSQDVLKAFKGWKIKGTDTFVTDTKSFYTAQDVTLVAVWEDAFATPFDTSKIGELFIYDDFGVASSAWNTLCLDRTGNKYYRSQAFTDAGLNVALSSSKGTWTDGGYYTVKGNVTYGYTSLYDGLWFTGNLPKGTYTVAVNLRFHNDDAIKIGFGALNKDHNDMVDIGAYTVNEWTTYTRTFYTDGTESGRIGSVVAWNSAAEGSERTFDYDNIAIYYLPDRTITFENTEGSVSQATFEVAGQYADISGVTATNADVLKAFKGWKIKGTDTFVTDTQSFYTANDVTLVAVWEDVFASYVDTSTFGELHLYDDFGNQSGTWVNLGKDRTGNKFYRGPEFTKNSALNVAITCPNNANAWSNVSYYSNTSVVPSDYALTDVYDGIWFSSEHPKGTYTIVVDMRFHSDDAIKIGFGAFDKNQNDMVEIGSYTPNEWATYTRTIYSADTLGASGGLVGSVVAWDDNAKGEERTFDYDNVAIFYLPNRTLTFSGLSENNTVEIGQYITQEQLSSVAAPQKDGFVFMGWSVTDDNTVDDLTQHFFSQNATVYPIFKELSYFAPEYDACQIKEVSTDIDQNGQGIRVIALAEQIKRLELDKFDSVEMGFIVTRQNILDSNSTSTFISPSDFKLGCGLKESAEYISAISYKAQGGVASIDRLWTNFHDSVDAFTGVVVGIPLDMYDDQIVFRAYIKFTASGTEYVVYGESKTVTVNQIKNAIQG